MNRREFLTGTATLAGALAVAPGALARLAGGGRRAALVTADTESHVVAVSLDTGRVLRRVRTIEGPRAVESVLSSLCVVCHTDEGALTILDGTGLEVLKVIRGLGEPRYVSVRPPELDDAHGLVAYVTDSATGELVTLDLDRRRIVHRLDIGGPARHVSIRPDGRSVWAVLGNASETVAIVDTREPRRPRLRTTISPPYLAHDVVISPDGLRAWVTGGSARTIGIYDTRTGRLVRRIAADAPPQHVTFGHRNAYVASGDSGTMRTHRAASGELLRVAPLPLGSYNVAGDFSLGARARAFTPSLANGTLTILDGSGRVLRETKVAANAHDAAYVLVA